MDFPLLEVVSAFVAILLALYLYGTWTFDRFAKHGVPYLNPKPFLGDFWPVLLRKENMQLLFSRAYEKYPEHRYVGFFWMRKPALVIRDPDLIRQITVKDFDYFADHWKPVDEKMDPIIGGNLMALSGQKWRDMRATLSPAFTGNKMRIMYTLVSECAQQTVEYLRKETGETGRKDLEMKNLFTTYTNDVIATSAFGIKVDSLKNPSNDFYRIAKKVTNFAGIKFIMKFIGYTLMPRMMNKLGIKFFDSECSDFFHDLIHGTISAREKEGIVRPDMVQLLMQARKGTLRHDATQQKDTGFATVTESEVGMRQVQKQVWNDDELTAQALIFILAGFEPTATALCFTCHELAVNPGVQKKLQNEIDEFKAENESPDYETINRMKYLDMVVSESLRMWPPGGFGDRVCAKSYVLEDHKGNKFQVEKGETVFIPVYQLHHDEKYYKNPGKFDPERFSEENKSNIKPYTYLPFGAGPRSCIGCRFALMEFKAIMFHILSHFDLQPCEKTQIPLKLSKKSITMSAENGFWLSFLPRAK